MAILPAEQRYFYACSVRIRDSQLAMPSLVNDDFGGFRVMSGVFVFLSVWNGRSVRCLPMMNFVPYVPMMNVM